MAQILIPVESKPRTISSLSGPDDCGRTAPMRRHHPREKKLKHLMIVVQKRHVHSQNSFQTIFP